LDKEPYQVQVAIRQAAVRSAQADLVAAQAQVRGLEAMGGAQRWQLESAMEQVRSQVANLHAKVAAYESSQATLELARASLKRGMELVASGSDSKEQLVQPRKTVKVNEAAVNQAPQEG